MTPVFVCRRWAFVVYSGYWPIFMLSIKSLNEGTVSPNTATVEVSDVSSGSPVKVYELDTNESDGFKIVAP